MDRINAIIIESLLRRNDYARRVIPYLKPEYFEDFADKWVVDFVVNYVGKYNTIPDESILLVGLKDTADIGEVDYKKIETFLSSEIRKIEDDQVDWLVDRTEKFCRERALYNALNESILIADGQDKDGREWGSIPNILTEALGVSFDERIGHDYGRDAGLRWDWYEKEEARIPFDLTLLNRVTRGGLPSKTLNVLLGATGTGKSLVMCHMAKANLAAGSNVLYITLELSEDSVGERIDANLMDIPVNDIRSLGKNKYLGKMEKILKKITGRLVIREYPTALAHIGHFRKLLEDLKIKEKFKPDIVYVDYLNICASYRYRRDGAVGSYHYVKSVAEELRGMAVEYDFPIVTATQTNREGSGSNDPDMKDTSESFGLPMTADFLVALVSTEELQEQGQMMFKVLKNRYNRLDYFRRFNVDVDVEKMRLSDARDMGDEVTAPKANDSSVRNKVRDFDDWS